MTSTFGCRVAGGTEDNRCLNCSLGEFSKDLECQTCRTGCDAGQRLLFDGIPVQVGRGCENAVGNEDNSCGPCPANTFSGAGESTCTTCNTCRSDTLAYVCTNGLCQIPALEVIPGPGGFFADVTGEVTLSPGQTFDSREQGFFVATLAQITSVDPSRVVIIRFGLWKLLTFLTPPFLLPVMRCLETEKVSIHTHNIIVSSVSLAPLQQIIGHRFTFRFEVSTRLAALLL